MPKLTSPTKVSKIVRYKLEKECVKLRKRGFSYQQIADELSASPNVPEDDSIDKFVVMRFLEKMPEVKKELVSSNRTRMLKAVNTNFDIIYEMSSLYGKTRTLLEAMEDDAIEKNRLVNPYQYKAIVSEMRELLGKMMDIQKEITDYQNIRAFMGIVLETLQEEAPDQIPVIVERLKLAKGTQWFANLIQTRKLKKNEDDW